MPIPIILGVIAAVAGTVGTGTGIHGGVKLHRANQKMKRAKERDDANISKFHSIDKSAVASMDRLGKYELKILNSFSDFSLQMERIQNRPSFADISIEELKLPELSLQDVKQVSAGAGVLIGGLGGGAIGAAGGFAAAGATTAAVTALGTASTGAAISSLSGAAATNATLAALGGGAIAAGGGGMALGELVLGATTAGIGLLIGGIIFDVVGSSIEGKAEKAVEEMLKNEVKINRICGYLKDLDDAATRYHSLLRRVNLRYITHMRDMKSYLDAKCLNTNKVPWEELPESAQQCVKTTVLLVGLLYNMCKVNIVIQNGDFDDINAVNHSVIDDYTDKAEDVIKSLKQK